MIYVYVMLIFSLGGSDGKESACNTRDLDLILGLGKSPGEGNGYPIHCSCLENSMDRGAPMGSQKVGYDWATNTLTFYFQYISFWGVPM